MVTPNLVGYVRRKLEQGQTPQQIAQTLKSHGWPEGDIRAVLGSQKPQAVVLSAVIPVQTLETGPLLGWLFRLGFAGVFLVNSAVAVVDPAGFVKLMQGSFVGALFPNLGPLVWLIALNDLVLGLLILSGRWAPYVLAWSGAWLLAVTLIKLSSLLSLG